MFAVFIFLIAGAFFPTECSRDWTPPELHGIRLGMTVSQVKRQLPFLKIPRADKYDVRETFLYITTNRREQKRLPRVFALEMWFWKNRLVRYILKYYGSDTPRGINQFKTAVETHLNLSQTNRISFSQYQCGNVIVSVAEDRKRTVNLRDAVGEQVLNCRVDESYGLKPLTVCNKLLERARSQ